MAKRRMMKAISVETPEDGFGVDMTIRISVKNAEKITGVKAPFDFEESVAGFVWMQDGKAFVDMECDNEGQCFNILNDVIDGKM